MTATGRRSRRRPASGEAEPPLTARSVIASTLLGMRPPRLETAILVRSCALFGITEGATRVAISRMVAAGELGADGAGYRLTGPLLIRQDRQDESRRGAGTVWDGRWTVAVVVADGRAAGDRTDLRAAAAQLRLAELREGVWLRPHNLSPDRQPRARAVVDGQCRRFTARLDDLDVDPAAIDLAVIEGAGADPAGAYPPGSDPAGAGLTSPHRAAADLAASLWDLDGWARRARSLQARVLDLQRDLDDGDLHALADGFVLSAAVLRHLQADPLLPAELLDDGWPGADLRTAYDRFDAAFTSVWTTWYHDQR